jgi:membrane-associated protease RseP (regulator of RpoE activity)
LYPRHIARNRITMTSFDTDRTAPHEVTVPRQTPIAAVASDASAARHMSGGWSRAMLRLLLLVFAGAAGEHALQAQGSIKLKIEVNEDGQERRIDTVIQLDTETLELDELLERLKPLDIEGDIDLDGISNGEDVEIIINRTQRLDGESFRLEMNELVPDLSQLMEDLQELQKQVRVYRSEAGDSERAFLGVYFDVEQLEERSAVRVTGVIDGTAAEKAGVQEDDLILGIDGRAFDGAYGIREALEEHAPGDAVTLQIERDGQAMELSANLGAQTEKQEFHWLGDDGRFEFQWDGDVDLSDMEFFLDEQASKAGVNKPFLGVYLGEAVAEGVRISGTVKGSTAESLGLQEGDVVQAINGMSTESVADLKAAIGSLEIGAPLRVEFLRNGEPLVEEGALQARPGFEEGRLFNEGLRDALQNIDQMIEEEMILEGEHLSEELLQDLARLREMEDMELILGGEELENDRTRVVRSVAVYITMDIPSEDDMEQLRANADPPLSEGEVLQLDMVRFQPNPSNGLFDLRFTLSKEGPVLVRLFDASGRQVFDSSFTAQAGENKLEVDALGEPKGVYYLVIEQGQQAYTRKVVIQ